MSEHEKNESGSQDAELRDLEPQKSAEQADGSEAEVKGGRKAGGAQQDYLKVTMSDVIISS